MEAILVVSSPEWLAVKQHYSIPIKMGSPHD